MQAKGLLGEGFRASKAQALPGDRA
jgi:hypothetical protein